MKNNRTTATAHTAGPWHTDWLDNGQGWILDAKGNYLADIVTKDECGFVVPRRQQKANAQLIAAAPDLLETCHALFKMLCDLSYVGETPTDELDERDREIVQMYDDVTTKAEGR